MKPKHFRTLRTKSCSNCNYRLKDNCKLHHFKIHDIKIIYSTCNDWEKKKIGMKKK